MEWVYIYRPVSSFTVCYPRARYHIRFLHDVTDLLFITNPIKEELWLSSFYRKRELRRMCPVPDIQALNAFWLILIYKRDEFLFSEFLGKTNSGVHEKWNKFNGRPKHGVHIWNCFLLKYRVTTRNSEANSGPASQCGRMSSLTITFPFSAVSPVSQGQQVVACHLSKGCGGDSQFHICATRFTQTGGWEMTISF